MLSNATVLSVRRRLPGAVRVSNPVGAESYVDWRDGALRWFNSTGTETTRRPLHLSASAHILAANATGSVALSGSDGFHISTPAGLSKTALGADAAAFLGDAVVASAPRGDCHVVALIDPTSGAITAQRLLHVADAGGWFLSHPTEELAFLGLGRGQDGVTLYSVTVNEATVLQVTELPVGADEIIADVHPRGDRLLLVDSQGDSSPRVLSWPGLQECGRFNSEGVHTAFGLADIGCWVDEEHIALYATENALLLTDQVLEHPQRVELPITLGTAGDIETLVRLSDCEVDIGVWSPEGRASLIVRFT